MEDGPLAKGVEEGEGAKKPETISISLQEYSQSHSDHRLWQGVIFKQEKFNRYHQEQGRAPAIDVCEESNDD